VPARVVLDRQDPRDLTTRASLHAQAEISAYLNHGRRLLIPGFTYETFGDADAALIDPTSLQNGAREKIQTALLGGPVVFDKASRWPLTVRSTAAPEGE